MAMMEEVSERGLGWPLGIGLAVAAVSAGPKIVKAGRPLLKKAIKGYLVVQAKSKEMFAETGERLQDLYAEAKHEYDEELNTMKAEEEAEREEVQKAEAHEEKATSGRKGGARARSRKKTDEKRHSQEGEEK